MGYLIFIAAFAFGYVVFMIAAYLLAQLLFHKIEVDIDDEAFEKRSHAVRVSNLRGRVRSKFEMKRAVPSTF